MKIQSESTQTAAPAADRTAAARASLASARAQSEAKQAAVVQAKAELSVATDALMAEGNAATRKNLTACEQALSIAMVEATGATNRVERATADLAAAERDEQAATLAKRAEQVAPAEFVDKVAPLASKLARARQIVSEHEAEAARLAKGFAAEASAVHGTARVDYRRLFESLTARASGLSAAAILAEVWTCAVPTGCGADETLSAVEGGCNPHDLARRLNALKAGEQALKVQAGGFITNCSLPSSSRADPRTLPLAQIVSCARDVQATRAAIEAMGFKGASDSIKPDALATALLAAGPAAVQEVLIELRTAPFLKFSPELDGDAKSPLLAFDARKREIAERAFAKLESLCPAVAQAIEVERPKPAAAAAARTTVFAGMNVDVRA
ncbi:MAG: hypothetical protein ABI548_16825 [Polyangiaceae bacterium]